MDHATRAQGLSSRTKVTNRTEFGTALATDGGLAGRALRGGGREALAEGRRPPALILSVNFVFFVREDRDRTNRA